MRRATIGLVVVIAFAAGCGNSGIEGTLGWTSGPSVGAHAANGSVKNNTSHSLTLDAKSMRLLDANGRKIKGRILIGTHPLPAHATTTLRATWKSGHPVRIDYGAGALALSSP
jgi:hypothetical protein